MVLHRQVSTYALGHNIRGIDGLVDIIPDREHKFPCVYLRRAIGGVDTALRDLHGKAQDKSVCELLGGVPRPMRVHGSSMRWDINGLGEATDLSLSDDEWVFDAFKVRTTLADAN